MARLYSNENLPFPVVCELRRLGHDVLTTQEAGQAGQAMPDEQVLALASSEGRVLITLNRRHFVRLHLEQAGHAGILVCTFDPDFQALARRIDQALRGQTELNGRLIRINRPPV